MIDDEVGDFYRIPHQPELCGFFETQRQRHQMEHLKQAISSGSIAAVLGDVGMGKSRMLWQLRQELDSDGRVMIPQNSVGSPQGLTSRALLTTLLHMLDANTKVPRDREKRLKALCDRLRAVEKPAVIIIDDAHHVSQEAMNALRDLIAQLREQTIRMSLLVAGQARLGSLLRDHGSKWKGLEVASMHLDDFQDHRRAFAAWLAGRARAEDRGDPQLTPEALDVLANAHQTPLGIVQGLRHVLEVGYEKRVYPITAEVVEEAEGTYPYAVRC